MPCRCVREPLQKSTPKNTDVLGAAAGRERGFTLPEMLVGAAVVVVMIGAVVPLIWISSGQFGRQDGRVSAMDNDRVAFDDITRTLREASSVEQLSPQSLRVITGNASVDPVILDCGLPTDSPNRYLCVRQNDDGTSKELIAGITNVDPFHMDVERRFVSVDLQMSPPGSATPVSLAGGVSLRAGG